MPSFIEIPPLREKDIASRGIDVKLKRTNNAAYCW